jgi:uncharacterized protein YbaR (Trm112 family)
MGERRVVLDQALLDVLVCPKCRGKLEYREEEHSLLCHACCLRYNIMDGIPVMLIDEAEPF